VREAGRRAAAVRIDVAEPESVEAGVREAADAFGRLDVLVNNAGMAKGLPYGALEALTPEIWDRLMAVNLRGPFLTARAAAPWLRKAEPGRIVNVGSMVGDSAQTAGNVYAPSKAAVSPLTRHLAAALAPEVLVNCVAPGLMEGTGMSGRASPEFVAEWRGRAALDRTVSLEEVAAQVARFAAAESVTGQVLRIDGGIVFG
jgi:3-oxoacyl-[acyl-carrier protein] reductase